MTHRRGVVVAIDAGQSGSKVRIERDDTGVVDELFPGIRTHEPLVPQLAGIARTIADEHGAQIDVLAAGISGLTDGDSDAVRLRSELDSATGPRVILAHDSITSYLGALGDRTGAVVAAGTGVVTLGVGRTRVARVDGWGNIMGDAGSGYWIGREALDAAMRAHDGRGEPTMLSEIVRRQWPDLETAYIALQASDDRVPRVASFARHVAELAPFDPVAAGICERAAAELALSVATALRRVHEKGDPAAEVCGIGGVFRSPAIRQAFERRLLDLEPSANVRAARGEGVDGAAALARLAPDHALLHRVSVA